MAPGFFLCLHDMLDARSNRQRWCCDPRGKLPEAARISVVTPTGLEPVFQP